jgi:hypothetical protein
MNTRTSAARLAKQVGIPKSRALEAVLKARLIAAVVHEVGRRGMTHAELAARSGLSRSAVTGILSGSLRCRVGTSFWRGCEGWICSGDPRPRDIRNRLVGRLAPPRPPHDCVPGFESRKSGCE